MFVDRIKIEKPNDIRYGTTKIPFHQTYGQIMGLLQKHGCDRVATMREGDIQRIAFEYEGNPYVVKIPRVYVKGIYNEKIGIRIVKYYLEIILDWAKQRIIDFEYLMLGTRMININGQKLTLKEAVDNLPPVDLMEGLASKTKQLKDGDVIDTEYEITEGDDMNDKKL